MTALRIKAGRRKRKMALLGALLVATAGSLLLLTDIPSALASDGSGSATLAELAARSPGARIGGIALKAKTKRKAPVALARQAASTPVQPGLGAPIASVMSAPPAAALGAPAPGFGPSFAPAAAVPTTPAPAPGDGAGFVPGPGGGGTIIGPGTPGGGTGVTPEPTPNPPVVEPTPPTVPPVAAVPEPGTWLMMIAGFGFVGGAMRSRRQRRPVGIA